MIYLDYSATTKTDEEVLDTFIKCSKEFIGNPNSLHILGVKSKNMIDKATTQIANLLNVKENEIIYTSGSSESNNLAIKGICEKYKNRGKHIITTPLEHSSIYGPMDYLKENGFKIDYVKIPHLIKDEEMISYHKITDMSYMFNSIQDTEVDLSNFDTTTEEDLSYMLEVKPQN